MRNALIAGAFACLVAGSAAAAAFGVPQDKKGIEGPKWKYLVVRLPANTVEIEFDSGNKGARLKSTVVTPLDSLGRDGWELVTATKDETSYVCFFKCPHEPR